MIRKFNNISICSRNSFNIDVVTRELIEFDTVEDLAAIFSSESFGYGWLVVSGGNNILFTKDVDMTILTPCAKEISIIDRDADFATVKVQAGVEWDDVVEWAVVNGLWGIENLSLIPGKAGAAPIQNIGAYGVEISDVLVGVEYFDTQSLEVKNIATSDCQFAYRESIFKRSVVDGGLKGVAIVTAITLKLSCSPNAKLGYADVEARVATLGGATLRNIRDVICGIRSEKLPDTKVMGNAGSFFKNPIVSKEIADKIAVQHPNMPHYPTSNDSGKVKLAAGWLIDKAGMKGYRSGCVGVHDRQALVLVNYGGAKGSEVLALAQKVQERVKESFSVEISTEVNIL